MRARLDALRRRETSETPLGNPGVTADQRDRLAALGYTSGGRSNADASPRPDPKDCIELLNTVPDGGISRGLRPLVPCR